MNWWRVKHEMVGEIGITAGLVLVQFLLALNSVLLSFLLSSGISSLAIVIFSNFAAFLILFPLAVVFERKRWPRSLTFSLVVKCIVMSSAGVAALQVVFFQGLELTSPVIATAMPNLTPVLVFLIAWTFRLEKVKLRCVYSRVKIAGTMVCVMGALIMCLMNSTSDSLSNQYDRDRLLGCLYLLASVLLISACTVLQASTLVELPAPLTLSAVTFFVGAVIAAAVQLLGYHRWRFGWPLIKSGNLVAISMLGGGLNGVSQSFLGWSMKKRGPVTVSLFTPVGTVFSVFFSMLGLGGKVKMESVAGMVLMFGGLYCVIWAKGKEGYAYEEVGEREKALLG